jgi:hypothetical protein
MIFKKEVFNELLNKTANSHSDDACNALISIAQHLSWGDRNVSQFFIQQVVIYLSTK